MGWFHLDVSVRDCTGPNVPISHHCPQGHDRASLNKSRLLFVSFSESEMAFLYRAARILAASGNWECSFLLLHEIAKDNPILAHFDAVGISHYASSEGKFYDDYTYIEPMPVLNRSYALLLQWWRGQKNNRPYLRLAVPLIRAGLFILWLFARFIPWLLRYKIKSSVLKAYREVKQFLRLKHTKIYNTLKSITLTFQSFLYKIPGISEGKFYDDYTYIEPMPVLNRSYALLLQWWRGQKNNRPYLRLAVPLIRAGLFILWLFARFIPWLLRYKIKSSVLKAYREVKQFLRLKHTKIYNTLKSITLTFQSFLYKIPGIFEYYFRIRKSSEESRLRGNINAASRFFAERTPDILILAKDSVYYPTTAFVQAARSLGIPSVVIPYDRADSVTLAKDRIGHPNHVIRSHAAREVAKKFPAWVYTHENQALLLVAPATIYAIERLNLSPPNPWGYNNSRCDRIFLETEKDRQLFLKSGAPPDQLVVVGAPYMDSLDEILCQRNQMRDQLCSTFGFAPDKPFVVASVSPNKVSQRSDDLEFKSYRTLIDKWSSALVGHIDCNLIYSLHPLTDHADVVFIEKKGGKILNLPLEELIAAADLYVVDCSSTAHWARYAGVDVLDYDFYKYNLWFNSEIEGVRHVTAYDDFISELIKTNERLMKPQYSTVIPTRQAKVSFRDNLSLELNNLLIASSQNPLK